MSSFCFQNVANLFSVDSLMHYSVNFSSKNVKLPNVCIQMIFFKIWFATFLYVFIHNWFLRFSIFKIIHNPDFSIKNENKVHLSFVHNQMIADMLLRLCSYSLPHQHEYTPPVDDHTLTSVLCFLQCVWGAAQRGEGDGGSALPTHWDALHPRHPEAQRPALGLWLRCRHPQPRHQRKISHNRNPLSKTLTLNKEQVLQTKRIIVQSQLCYTVSVLPHVWKSVMQLFSYEISQNAPVSDEVKLK